MCTAAAASWQKNNTTLCPRFCFTNSQLGTLSLHTLLTFPAPQPFCDVVEKLIPVTQLLSLSIDLHRAGSEECFGWSERKKAKINLQLSKQEHHVQVAEWNRVVLGWNSLQREKLLGLNTRKALSMRWNLKKKEKQKVYCNKIWSLNEKSFRFRDAHLLNIKELLRTERRFDKIFASYLLTLSFFFKVKEF